MTQSYELHFQQLNSLKKKKKSEAKSERVLGEKRRVRMRWIDGEVK